MKQVIAATRDAFIGQMKRHNESLYQSGRDHARQLLGRGFTADLIRKAAPSDHPFDRGIRDEIETNTRAAGGAA